MERGYPKQMIDSQMGKVKFDKRSKVGSKPTGVGFPFVITHQPKLKKIVQIMKKLEHQSYQGESVKRVLTPPLKVSNHNAKK